MYGVTGLLVAHRSLQPPDLQLRPTAMPKTARSFGRRRQRWRIFKAEPCLFQQPDNMNFFALAILSADTTALKGTETRNRPRHATMPDMR